MSEPLLGYINGCAEWADSITYTLNFVVNNCNALATALNTDGNPNAAAKCTDLANSISGFRTTWGLTGYNFRNYLIWSLLEINTLLDATGAIDMDTILDAIWNSDKLRWFHFINYIDAMRGGIWNTEIYETHLAEWYRHFSI